MSKCSGLSGANWASNNEIEDYSMLEVQFCDGADLDRYGEHYARLMENAFGQPPQNGLQAFRLKHLENPFGRSYAGFVFDANVLVGMNLFWRWEFIRGNTVTQAVQSCDTAVHTAHRGKALFTRIQEHCGERLPQHAIRFGFPNANSAPGFKKLGWSFQHIYTKSTYVRSAAKFVEKRVIGAGRNTHNLPRSGATSDAPDVDIDWFLLRVHQEGTYYRTRYSANFLRWRAALNPTFSWTALRGTKGIIAIVIYSIAALEADPSYRIISIADIVYTPSTSLWNLRSSLNEFLRANQIAEIQHTTTRATWLLNSLGLLMFRRSNALILHPHYGWGADFSLSGFVRNSALTTADTDHFQ